MCDSGYDLPSRLNFSRGHVGASCRANRANADPWLMHLSLGPKQLQGVGKRFRASAAFPRHFSCPSVQKCYHITCNGLPDACDSPSPPPSPACSRGDSFTGAASAGRPVRCARRVAASKHIYPSLHSSLPVLIHSFLNTTALPATCQEKPATAQSRTLSIGPSMAATTSRRTSLRISSPTCFMPLQM